MSKLARPPSGGVAVPEADVPGASIAASDAPVPAGRDVDPIELALLSLLERHPSAAVGAIGGDPPQPVAVPTSLPVSRERLVEPGAVRLSLVPADQAVGIRLWAQARARGIAVGRVRLRQDPARFGNLHMFDLRSDHGVVVVTFVDGDAAPVPGPATPVGPALRPRYARVTKDATTLILSADPELSGMLGWAPEELIGRRAIELIHPDDREGGIAAWLETLENEGRGHPVRLRHRRRDGSWLWLEVTNHNRLADRDHGDVLSEMVDVSAEMAAHDTLRVREQLLAQVAEAVPVGLFHTDRTGLLLFANRRLHELTGVTSATTLAGELATVVPEDRSRADDAVRATLAGTETSTELALGPAGDAVVRHCWLRVRPFTDESGAVVGLTGCLQDVSDVVRSRLELEAKAASDPLTGCLNREATLEELGRLLAEGPHGTGSTGGLGGPGQGGADAGTPGRGTAVFFVDLDGLKAVNDSFGHAAGDELLVKVAKRIRSAVRSDDLVGRFGGDEFVVVCPAVPGTAQALGIAQAIDEHAFTALELRSAETIAVKGSIGVAWTERHDVTPSLLVHLADEAMYQSKRAGLGKPVLTEMP